MSTYTLISGAKIEWVWHSMDDLLPNGEPDCRGKAIIYNTEIPMDHRHLSIFRGLIEDAYRKGREQGIEEARRRVAHCLKFN